MTPRERHQDPIERVTMEGRQRGGGTRQSGIERKLTQLITLTQPVKPLERGLLQAALTPCDPDGDLPRADARHVGLGRPLERCRRRPWQVALGQRQQRTRIEEYAHFSPAGHSSSDSGSVGV